MNTSWDNEKLTIELEGRIDSGNASDVESEINEEMKDNGKYIPSAAKWLDGKWEDYVSQPKAEVRATWTEY